MAITLGGFTSVSDLSIVNQTGSQMMYRFKKLLAGAGSDTSQGSAGGAGTATWKVLGSSDGSSFNTAASGIDYWQSGSSGAKGCANSQAWVRLQMPSVGGIQRELLIQRNTTNTSWRVGYSYSAGFTGTGNGAISATVAPTATDAQDFLSTSTPTVGGFQSGGAAYTAFFATDNTYVCSIAAQSVAPYGFWLWTSTSLTAMSSGFMLDPLLANSYPSGDPEPYVLYGTGASGTFGAVGAMGGSAIIVNTSGVKAWLKKGIAGEGFVQLGAADYVLNTNAIPAATQLYQNYDGNDILIPVFYGRVASLAAPVGGKGTSSLMKSLLNVRNFREALSVGAGSRNYIVVGVHAVDWDGSAPALWPTRQQMTLRRRWLLNSERVLL